MSAGRVLLTIAATTRRLLGRPAATPAPEHPVWLVGLASVDPWRGLDGLNEVRLGAREPWLEVPDIATDGGRAVYAVELLAGDKRVRDGWARAKAVRVASAELVRTHGVLSVRTDKVLSAEDAAALRVRWIEQHLDARLTPWQVEVLGKVERLYGQDGGRS